MKITNAALGCRRLGDPKVHIPRTTLRDTDGHLIGVATFDAIFIRPPELRLFILRGDEDMCLDCLEAMRGEAA